MEKELEKSSTLFLPAPFPLKQSHIGLLIPESDEYDIKVASLVGRLAFNITPSANEQYKGKEIPHNLFCLAFISDILDAHICKKCGVYCPSKAGIHCHALMFSTCNSRCLSS